jgi:hypothetical protein
MALRIRCSPEGTTMRARGPIAIATLAMLSLLAACGGGGGTPTPFVSAPASSAPGPGGGPTPSTTATPSPTPSPTGATTGTPSPKPTSTPTAAPTATPTVKPTATPTAVPTATPTPAASATPSSLNVTTGFGETNGADNAFVPDAGDMSASSPGAMPGGGGNGQAVDNITCDQSMYTGPVPPGYHVHAFVGLYVNGQELSIPRGVGMEAPGGTETYGGVPNQTEYATCFYDMHTHDPSGLVHMESANPTGVPQTGSIFTLGNFLDIWGINVTPTSFGPYQGPVSVYTSGQVYRGHMDNGHVYSNTYTLYTGDPHQIPMYSHEVIWFVVGSGNPTGSSLPNITFWTEY